MAVMAELVRIASRLDVPRAELLRMVLAAPTDTERVATDETRIEHGQSQSVFHPWLKSGLAFRWTIRGGGLLSYAGLPHPLPHVVDPAFAFFAVLFGGVEIALAQQRGDGLGRGVADGFAGVRRASGRPTAAAAA